MSIPGCNLIGIIFYFIQIFHDYLNRPKLISIGPKSATLSWIIATWLAIRMERTRWTSSVSCCSSCPRSGSLASPSKATSMNSTSAEIWTVGPSCAKCFSLIVNSFLIFNFSFVVFCTNTENRMHVQCHSLKSYMEGPLPRPGCLRGEHSKNWDVKLFHS